MSDLERVAIAMRHRYAEMTNDLPLVPFEKSQARAAWLECARVAIETMGADDTLWQRENHDLVEEKAALRAENDRLREILKTVPDALNSALQAGMEEREGGSANRQERYMKPVYELRAAVRAALTKDPN